MENNELFTSFLNTDEMRNSNCYLKKCRDCWETIFMCTNRYGKWSLFESWYAGNARVGEFTLHDCRKFMTLEVSWIFS